MPRLMSLPVTRQCPTMHRGGTSPTELGPIRSVPGTNLKRRLGKVRGMKKLLGARTEDARTLQNMTMSSRLSELEVCCILQNILQFRNKYTQTKKYVNRDVFSIVFPPLGGGILTTLVLFG